MATLEVSHKSYAVTLVLAIFSGFAGFHRFYVGKVGTGLLWFLTAGMFVFGWLIDIFTVLAGNFTDKAGAWVKPGHRETSMAADGVTKPFYTRWWFIGIVMVVVIGLLAG
jgi:TM2 domain.